MYLQIYNMFPWLGCWLKNYKLTVKNNDQNKRQIKELVDNLEKTLNLEETSGLVDSFLICKRNAEVHLSFEYLNYVSFI